MAESARSGALRRGLTFWRRSIQARVVVSTVLLSAVVIAGVGWFLLRQVQEGLLDHRLDAVLAEAANETAGANERLSNVPGVDTNTGAQLDDLVDPIKDAGAARGFQVVLAGPGGLGGAAGDPGPPVLPGTSSSPACREPMVERFSAPQRPGVGLHAHRRERRGRGDVRGAGHRGGLAGRPAGERRGLHALLPVLPRGGRRDPRPGHPRPAHGRRAAAGAGGGPDAGWSPGRSSPRSGWRAASPSDWPPASSRSGSG